MDVKRLADRAKALVEKRGGPESLKGDAAELSEIARGRAGFGDKAKAAFGALRDPGARPAGGPANAPPAAAEGAPTEARGEGARKPGRIRRRRRRRGRRDGV